jgi:hypothetical protein
MITQHMGNRLPAHGVWAMDNGCYSQHKEFSLSAFLKKASQLISVHGDRCLFVVAPDVPFNAEGTIERWRQTSSAVKELGRPTAFVTQDGMGYEDIPWKDCDALFVGGSTLWKLGHESTAIIHEAKQRGHWVHVGRVNSLSRMRVAASAGADSADGTYLKYGPDINWPKLKGWLDTMNSNPVMRLTG